MSRNLIAFFDGGQDSRSKQMLSGFWISRDDGMEILNSSVVREVGTTNQAEFRALIGLLDTLSRIAEPGSAITIYGDSQILINAVNDIAIIKHPNLIHLFSTIKKLVVRLRLTVTVQFIWTERTGNKAADYLANLQVINNQRFNPESVREHEKINAKLAKLKAKDIQSAKDKQGRERTKAD